MDDNNDKRGLLSTLSKEGLKVAWKLLPPPVKIGIIAGIGGVLLFIMIIGLIISLNPINFLNYSDDVKISTDLEKTYEDDWTYLCKGDGCTAAEQTKINSIINSQKRFYDELEKIVENNKLTKRQRYLILTTIFYNYDIEDFTEIDSDSGAYKLDGNDRIIDEEGSYGNAYSEEYDTIKELTKQFITYPIYCVNGDSEEEIKKSDGTTFSFGFFQRASIFIGGDGWDKEFGTVKKNCEDNGGRIEIKKDYSSSSSEDAFYEYLRSSTYIDSRSQFDSEFETYANANNLNIEDKKNWAEEDKLAVKNQIIDDIKDIVDDYEKYNESEESNTLVTICTSTDWWWPVGSNETEEINGVTFATGAPALASNPVGNSRFGMRWGKMHNGIDVGSSGKIGVYNIIAPKDGTVEYVFNGCSDNGTYGNSCGGYRGNQVYINHGDGTYSRAQHMAKNSVTVKVGDVVKQGQVIGKIGMSGSCKGAHLHFEIKTNNGATYDNPMNYIDANNPRPGSGSTCGEEVNFTSTSLTKEEFITKLENFYSNETCNSSSSQYSRGCGSFKSQILNNNGAEIIYDVAKEHNKNPELIVARSRLEGYSPGSGYNYFGYRCYNGKSASSCRSFSSFRDAMNTFFSNADNYDTLTAMMSKYAYIGDYWYSGSSGSGGCYYYQYIKDFMQEDRARTVGAWCPQGCNSCRTNDEDQRAYASYQVKRMAEQINLIFK